MNPLRQKHDPTPRLYYCFLAVPPLSLLPLSSLTSTCSNLPFGPKGRLWRLESGLQERGKQKKGFRACKLHRAPHGFRILSSLSFFIWKVDAGERENECVEMFLARGGLLPGMTWSICPSHMFPFTEHHAPTVPFILGSRLSVESK